MDGCEVRCAEGCALLTLLPDAGSSGVGVRLDRGLYRLAAALEGAEAEAGHARRVSALTQALALEMGLTAACAQGVGQAANLHDLGKLLLPRRLLDKPGPLSPEERRVLERHPRIGHALLLRQNPLAAMGALSHHERYDGAGYPLGLAGVGIPWIGRLIAVADAFDAMTQVRPYRKALTADQARAELKRGAGRQFDPGLVQVALGLPGFAGDRSAEPIA